MKISSCLAHIDLTVFLILDIDNLARFPLDQWYPVSHRGVTHYFMRTNSFNYENKTSGEQRELCVVGNRIRFIKDNIFVYDYSRYVMVNTDAQSLIHSPYQDIIPYED